MVWQIEWLKRFGLTDIILSVGYRRERLMKQLGDGGRLGVTIEYSVEEEPLGTGGGLKRAEHLLGREARFLVLNGDIVTNLNLRPLLEIPERALAAIALVPLKSPYGVVDSGPDGLVHRFREKPTIMDYWINAGVYHFKREVLDYLPAKGSLEEEVLARLAGEKQLLGVKFSGCFWRSIDSHKDIEEASAELKGIAPQAPPSPPVAAKS